MRRRIANLKTANTSKLCSEIVTMCSEVQSLFTKVGIDGANLEKLASLDTLPDHDRIQSQHQNFVKDEKWNQVISQSFSLFSA